MVGLAVASAGARQGSLTPSQCAAGLSDAALLSCSLVHSGVAAATWHPQTRLLGCCPLPWLVSRSAALLLSG